MLLPTSPELRPGAELTADAVRFGLADPGHTLAGVRLWQEVGISGDLLDFVRVDGGWELELPAPAVRRLEYLLELHHRDGSRETVLDPVNPLRVGGVFGDHSVVEAPGYTAPWWLDAPTVAGRTTALAAPPARGLRRDLPIVVWQPEDAGDDEPLPLLLAHDGPQLAELASLTRYAAALIAAGRLPRHRVALLHPPDRDAWYSASPAYARSLVRSAVPLLRERFAVTGLPAITGASLGGLAALHAEWSHPGTFGAVFAQSGSFFQLRTDAQEQGYPRFWRIDRFVHQVLVAHEPPSRPHVGMTCGAIEENVHNNRVMARRLAELGCPVAYAEVPDVHTWTCWRDSLDPHLTALLQQAWGQ